MACIRMAPKPHHKNCNALSFPMGMAQRGRALLSFPDLPSTCMTALVLSFIMAMCVMSAPASAITVEELLGAMPADDAATADRLFGEALDAGEALLDALCARITPSEEGVDAAAYYALQGLVNHAARPGNNTHRVRIARQLEQALLQRDAHEPQRFFMSLLRVCGDTDTINALAPLVCDDALYDDAIMTIEAVGGEAAVKALAALDCDDNPAAMEAARAALIQMRHRPAPHIDAGVLDADIHDAALVSPSDAEARARIASACRAALTGDTLSRPERIVALRALVLSSGEDALPALLAAMSDADSHYWGAALELARELPGADVSHAFAQQLDQFPAQVRPQVIFMLGHRDDAPAQQAIRAAMTHAQAETRLAAYAVVARQGVDNALTPLTQALQQAEDAQETDAIKNALLRLPDPEVSDNAATQLPRLSGARKAACLDIIAARRAARHLNVVRGSLEDEESQVRRAAFSALAVIGVAEDVERLYASLLAVSGNAEISAVRDAIADIAKRTDTVPEAVAQAEGLLEKPDAAQRKRLLETVRALGGEAALAAARQFAEKALFNDANEDAAVAALETFGAWPDARAADILRDFFERVDDAEMRVTVLRQLIMAVQRGIHGERRQQRFLEQADEHCRTDEERTLLADAIQRIQPRD